MLKITSDQRKTADQILSRLDKMAGEIQTKFASWGLSKTQAKELVNGIDKTADDIETFIYGGDSLRRRQAEIAINDPELAKAAREEVGRAVFEKAAAVIQRDSDESYMDTFKNPMKPIQTDADEPYMSAYDDDQSSAVSDGEDETGRELAPEA